MNKITTITRITSKVLDKYRKFYIARAPMTEVADAINYSVRRAYHFRKMGVTHLGEVLG